MQRPVVMPEAYDGEGDWNVYIQYFNNCRAINGWTEDQSALVLGVRVQGAAQAFHATLQADVRADWDELTQAFTARFAPAEGLALYKAEFKNRRRRKGEPLGRLADDIRRLALRAYPNAAAPLVGELAKDQFIDALPRQSPLRLRLKEATQLDTLNAVVERAIHLESMWEAETDDHSAASTYNRGPDSSNEAPAAPNQAGVLAVQPPAARSKTSPASQLTRLESTVTRLEAVAGQMAGAAQDLVRALDSIRLSGHGAGSFGSGRRGRSATSTRRDQCFFCGDSGHFARDCPQRSGNEP